MTTLREALEKRPWFGWVHPTERDDAERDFDVALRAAYAEGVMDGNGADVVHSDNGVAAGVAALKKEGE